MSDQDGQNAGPGKGAVGAPDPKAGGGRSGGLPEVQFNNDIVIHPSVRLDYLDKGDVKAYKAQGKGKAPPNLFALICEDSLTPRTIKASNYVALPNPTLAKLIASGTFYWEPEKRERYAFIYENNVGMPLLTPGQVPALGWKPEEVLSSVVKPMLGLLMDFHKRDIVHGEIWPGNMFDAGHKKPENVMLGECLSTPSSWALPALYEPIERAMADPVARGMGTIQDDLYSLGVSLAVLLRTHDPCAGMRDEEVIQHKMEHGSYNTLIFKDRFTGSILELLRGLLYDDANQRWTLDDVDVWLDGRRLSPKQAAKKTKAARAIAFNGHKYTQPESLARDVNKNPADVIHIIESGEMNQWVQRAISDRVFSQRVEKAIALSAEGGRGSSYPEHLAARIAMALDPDAPIRYKTLSVMPDGIGKGLTHAYVTRENIHLYEEFIHHHFIVQWIEAVSSPNVDANAVVSKLDSCRNFLRQAAMGYGMERCIYFLNPECHCLSDKLKAFYARSPEDILLALEKIATQSDRPVYCFDRHIAAFLSVKDGKNIDPYLRELNAGVPYKKVLAELKTLASIQKRSRMASMPGVAGWIVDNLGPVYERFHDRELQKWVQARAEKLKMGGDLTKIANLFYDEKINDSDRKDFFGAIQRHMDLEAEGRTLAIRLAKDKSFGMDEGRQMSALISAVLAGITIVISVMAAFSGHGGVGF